jgi:peroxiredoxin
MARENTHLETEKIDRRSWIFFGALTFHPVGTTRQDRPKSPPLTVYVPDRDPIDVHAQLGKVVIVDFMTTICPSCKLAAVGLEKLYREFRTKGFLPLGVALDQRSALPLLSYRRQLELSFPIGAAPRKAVVKYLAHPAGKPLLVPTLVLLDKQGRVHSKQVGWKGDAEMRALLKTLLSE